MGPFRSPTRPRPRRMGAARPVLAFTLLALTPFVLPGAALAQEVVHGFVRDADTAAPIEGAMLVLISGQSVHARTLSASDGSFRLRAPLPGRYRLRVDRIGYASTFSDDFDVVSGEPLQIRVAVPVHAVTLRGLDVTGGTRCRSGPGRDAATAVAWQEARKALEAARWTSERGLYRFAWIRYVRELDEDGARILSEDRERRRAFTPRPFRSVHPDTLAREGFLHERGGETFYLAPDAEVLLSAAFLQGHCFGLDVREMEGRSMVGLLFRPVPGRRLPDVQGALWLDRSTGRLESVEYEYVNLPRAAPVDGDDASGQLRFRELPNGTWIVEEWSIRMPKLVEIRDREERPRRYDVSGYVEEGGRVMRISNPAGLVVDGGSASGVQGVVTDSLGHPAAGARVWLVGSGWEASTNGDGAFHLDEVGAAIWSIRANHPTLSRYGYAGTAAEVAVERDRVRQVRLALPSIGSVVLDRCDRSTSAEADSVTLVGRVLGPDGAPASGAAVRVVWTEARGPFRRSFEGFGADSDSLGVFTVCAIPVGRTVMATASVGDRRFEGPAISPDNAPGVVGVDLVAVTAPESLAETDPRAFGEAAAWMDSVGFPRRRSYALLHRTNRQIVDLGYDSVPQLLAEVPRIEVRPLLTGETEFWMHPTEDWTPRAETEGSCQVDFYLNGNLVRQRIGQNWEVSLHRIIEPIFITGLEIHDPETAPVGDPDSCGAVLLWLTKLRHKDDPSFTGRVRGRVMGLSQAMAAEDVRLRLKPGGSEVGIDENGSFDFGSLPPARYTIEAVVPEWGTWSSPVDLRMHAVAEVVIEVVGDPSGRRDRR